MARRLLFAAAVAGCAAQSSALPAGMTGVTWKWIGLMGPTETIVVDGPERYTIAFGEEGRASLRADCNRGSGRYQVAADRGIEIGPVALTRMACPPGSLSDRYVRDVERAEKYSLTGGDLVLQLRHGAGAMHFQRTE